MAAPYIHTPRTNDASYISNGFDQINELSPEKSFAVPVAHHDLISHMKKAGSGGMSFKTPRVGGRDPLRLLPNGNQPQAKSEFTPLLRSVAKTNISKRLSTRKPRGIDTPAHLRNSYVGGATPALPRMEEESNIQSEHTGISDSKFHDYTPMPQNLNSSAQSTPLVQLPAREAVINDGNMMTLREQENIIDKIEKENFGLKMKIHFLEEAIAKRGGDFNQAALKENTDLKVNRITMQRELHKFKKTLAQAERDAEIYRQQLEEYKERIRRKQMDESIRIEVENVRSEMRAKVIEFNELRTKYDSIKTQSSNEIERLKGDLEDVHAELRQRERDIEAHEDEIDILKSNAKKESNLSSDLEEKFEAAQQKIQDLKADLEHVTREAQEAKEEQEDVLMEKRRAEQDLDELRDEIANKSFTEKGMNKRMDERIEHLKEENEDLHERCKSMKQQLEEKSHSEKLLQQQLSEMNKEGAAQSRQLHHEVEMIQQQRDSLERKYNTTLKQMESLEREIEEKKDEKHLLQMRHDALTTESAGLQKDLEKARKNTADLEQKLEQERQRSAQNDDFLRSQHRTEIDILNEQIDQLHNDVNSKERTYASDKDEWDTQRRNLEAVSQRAEEKAAGLQRTVDKLQDAQGTLSGREIKIQEALESEKQRHLEEERVLSRQISELNDDLAAKRVQSEQNRGELNNAREELRISIREQAALKEKVAELEDEIEVLQADIEQEHEFIQQLQSKSGQANDAQINKLRKEKQELHDSLASINADLQVSKRSLQTAQTEKDELERKLESAQKPNDDTFDVQQEKREWRRVKQNLEKELDKTRAERDGLSTANDALEIEINAEIDRANTEEARLNSEIAQLKSKIANNTDTRERELISSKSKVAHLENRVRDLQALLDERSQRIASPGPDVSGLRHDLVEARRLETASTKRELELKSANRDLKMQINALEKDLHEARLAQLKSRSPMATPSPAHSGELAQSRQQLIESEASLRKLQQENRDLKRNAQCDSASKTQKLELEALYASSSEEVDRLAGKLLERDNKLIELKAQIERIRSEQLNAHKDTPSPLRGSTYTTQITELKAQVKRLRAERDEVRKDALQLSVRDKEAGELKQELQRLRRDRVRANGKVEEVEKELEVMQSRYESMLERLSSVAKLRRRDSDTSDQTDDVIRTKEIKGLMQEIIYLKSKLRREERLRSDLAWTKDYLKQGEAMRVQCNQIDLRILREMGVDTERHITKFTKPLTLKQKFKAGVFVVMASIRLKKMEEQWRVKRQLGENLRKVRMRQLAR